MEIAEIKSKLTLAEVIRHYGLKADKHNRLNCPFHEDKTPSLQLYWKTHTAYCFSSNCSTGGKSMDVIDFIMHKENISKHEALVKATVMLGGNPSNEVQALSRTTVLANMFTYFKNAVHNSKPAQEYLKSRNLDYEILSSLGSPVGYNSGQFHHGTRRDEVLIKSCLKLGLLSEAGINSRNTELQAYKPFAKYCITFALRNKENQVSGLYFRSSISDAGNNKHYYLKEREGLYPKHPSEATRRLILTESIIDAATLLQVEEITKHYEILALYGTNGFTEEHAEAIKGLKELEEVIFFLDGDEPGRKAAAKYTETIKSLKPETTITEVETPDNEDVNSLLAGHEKEIFLHLLSARNILHPKQQEVFFSPEKETPVPASQIREELNTANPDEISWKKDSLKFTLLGGLSLANLDRMRVTLKIALQPEISPLHSIRNNIDLYHDEQVEKFTRRAAERLEKGTSVISAAIAELIELLEKYRLGQIEKKKVQKPKGKQLTETEIREAREYLSAPNLMERTQKDLGETGITGEEKNRLIMYLVMTSRKRENPLHIISLGVSGAGKTYLQEKVSQCIPEEDKLEITVMSENALYYFEREELKHKLILIEDMDGAEAVLYPLRELQSKKKITKTVTLKDSKGNLKTMSLTVEGPVTVAGCTTREVIYEDNANRSFMICIDESKEQDARIMHYQRNLSAGLIDAEKENRKKESFKNMQRILKPIAVRNPYAPKLIIPESILKPRRTNSHYLSCIEVITFYNQYQREKKRDPETGEIFIETTLEDIAEANRLLEEILLRKSDDLSGACRSFLEKLKIYMKGKESFYAKEIRGEFRMNPSNLKRYLIELSRNGYLRITGGSKRMGFEYEIVSYEEYNNLKKAVSGLLDSILNELKEAKIKGNGSMVHNGSVQEMNHSLSSVSVN